MNDAPQPLQTPPVDARATPLPAGLSERRTRTILLLESRLDWHPVGRDSVASLQATAKPGVGAWVRCDRCAGSGRVVGFGLRAKACRASHTVWPSGHGCRPCLVCEDGWVATRGEDGSDRMLAAGVHGLHEEGLQRHEARAARDRMLAALSSQLARPSSSLADDLAATRPERWERDRDRHYRQGSYRELDLALEWLGGRSPSARQLVEWAYEFRVIHLGSCRREVVAAAEACVDVVASRLPDPVRVPGWLLPRAGGPSARVANRRAQGRAA